MAFVAIALVVLLRTFRDGFPTKARIQLRLARRMNRQVGEAAARAWQVVTIAGVGAWLAFLFVYLVLGIGG